MERYKKTFGRDSFDNKGTEVPVVIHTGAYLTWLPDGVGAQFMNNAAWRGSANEFNFFDNSDSLLQYPTTAVAVDVATHEYTHGVISSVTWQWKPLLTYSRSETFSTIPYFFRNCLT